MDGGAAMVKTKPEQAIIDALEAVAAGARSARIHLGSLEPTVVTDSFV